MSAAIHTPRIGFCGLGLMGFPMARRLLDAGHTLRVWNRSAGKTEAFLNLAQERPGACMPCVTPAELAAQTDVMLLCLTDTAAVEAVAFGTDGLATTAGSGSVVVDHSTLSPAATHRLARRWQTEVGGSWIDAPVSGGTAGAAAGTLAIMAGGDAERIDHMTPVLSAYAARITRMGESGAGQATKLANQTIVMTTIAGLAEAVRLANHVGIDTARIPQALQGGWADSVLMQTLMPRMVTPPARPTGTIRTMLKDMDAVQALAREHGTSLPLSDRVRRWLVKAVEAGLGEADISRIVQVMPDE
jgi:3-hydroxyisobutyrate dehydrogenase-like beta-hydroxyacid dehydrogenase